MRNLYKKLYAFYECCIVIPIFMCLRLAEFILGRRSLITGKNSLLPNSLNPEVPLYYDYINPVRGIYTLRSDARYRIRKGSVTLITLNLRTFKKYEKILYENDTVAISPFTLHAFLCKRSDENISELERTSKNSATYSFEIDLQSEYGLIPDDFRLDRKKLQISEMLFRLIASRYFTQGLTYDNYGFMLLGVLKISRFLKFSSFEHTLVYGIVFDILQRLSDANERFATISFGPYERVYSLTGKGYHDISATEIGYDAGFIVDFTHRTHFDEERRKVIPPIKIGKNIIIEQPVFIEVGLGLSVGDFSWIASGVTFLKHAHDPKGGGQFNRTVENTIFYPTEIGPYAFIGQNAKILAKTLYIGKGSVIGHSAIVTSSVGDYAIVAGNPSKVIRYNIELAKRLEHQGSQREQTLSDEEIEPLIDYESVLRQGIYWKNIIISGVKNVENIFSATKLFKKCLVVSYCIPDIVSFLEELSKLKVNNVCLQSGEMAMSWEFKLRSPFVMVLLAENGDLTRYEETIKQNCEGVIVPEESETAAYLNQNDEFTLHHKIDSGYILFVSLRL